MTEQEILQALTLLSESERGDARRRSPGLRPKPKPLSSGVGLFVVAAAGAFVGVALGTIPSRSVQPPQQFELVRAAAPAPTAKPVLLDAPPPLQLPSASTPLPVQAARLLAWSPPSLRPLGRYQPMARPAEPPRTAPIEAPPPPVVAAVTGSEWDLVASLGLHGVPPNLL